MRIFLMRHAESYNNTQGKIMSATDLPLTDKGIQQANAVKAYINNSIYPKRFTNVFCSSLLRANQTANIIIENNIEIVKLDSLKEMDLGELEGLTWVERATKYPHIDIENSLSDVDFPKGEKFLNIKARCSVFIEKHLSVLEDDAYVLVVTHGITARVLTNLILTKSDKHINWLNWLDCTSFSIIDYNSNNCIGSLIKLNDRTHLTEHNLGTSNYEEWGLFSKIEYCSE